MNRWFEKYFWPSVPLVLGLMTLCGWILDNEYMKAVLPGFTPMNPVTAALFVTAAVALLGGSARAVWMKILATVILLTAAGRLAAYIMDTPFLDSQFFQATLRGNRMAPSTTVAFLCLAVALFMRACEYIVLAQAGALAVLWVSFLSLLGYIYSVEPFYKLGVYVAMAVNTALAFTACGLAILLERPRDGILRPFTGASPSAAAARRLLVAAILVPGFLGWLRLLGGRHHYYSEAVGVALYAMSMITVLLVSVWVVTFIARRAEVAREAAELALQTSNDMLQRHTVALESANKELEAFSYSVSHDLRAPLRAVSGFSNVLLEDHAEHLGDEGKRVIDLIRQSSMQMGSLIDDLLQFSRLGRQGMRLCQIDMRSLAQSAWNELSVLRDGREISFEISALPRAWVDAALMRCVWANLLSNAIKYTKGRPGRAMIRITGQEDGHEARYEVHDNGVGFDMQYAGNLFKVFQRLHSSSEFDGTGIGLAIVQRVVHRHGGHVWASGVVGQGAKFGFAVPITSGGAT